MPAMPAPSTTTDLPLPTLAGQSPGRGDTNLPGGGGGSGRAGAADEEPQAFKAVPMPIAAIVRSIAEPPTALPMEVRKSRLAIRVGFDFIRSWARWLVLATVFYIATGSVEYLAIFDKNGYRCIVCTIHWNHHAASKTRTFVIPDLLLPAGGLCAT